MKRMPQLLVIFFMLSTVHTTLAQDNAFLDRGYWKTNPSIAEIEALISEGNDITELNRFMFDPVCYALLERVDNATVKHMIQKKGNAIDKLTHDGRTYIFWAAYRDNLELMQWLVDKGAEVDTEDSHGYSVLNFAAVTGQRNPKLYDFLLENGANIDDTNHSGANALLLVASFAKDFGILDYFVEKGLDIKSVDAGGNGLFHYAAKGGHAPLLKTMVNRGLAYKTINAMGENAMHMAAKGTRGRQNGKGVFEYLQSLGLSLDLINKDGQNLLHHISRRNTDVALFNYLMDEGLDITLQDKEGQTPLMNASRSNSLEIVQWLTKAIKHTNTKNNKGRSALALATWHNTPKVVAHLLEHGADVSVIDKNGNSLAYYLIKNYDPKKTEEFEAKLKLLTSRGLMMDLPQEGGNTLLHLAAKDDDLALLKRLKAFNININSKNAEGNTALHLAAMSSGDETVLKYLIGQGADKNTLTEFEETVYDLASENELLRGQNVELEFLKR